MGWSDRQTGLETQEKWLLGHVEIRTDDFNGRLAADGVGNRGFLAANRGFLAVDCRFLAANRGFLAANRWLTGTVYQVGGSPLENLIKK